MLVDYARIENRIFLFGGTCEQWHEACTEDNGFRK